MPDINAFSAALGAEITTLPDICFKKDIPGFTEAVNCIGEAMEIRLPVQNLPADEEGRQIVAQTAKTLDELTRCPEHTQCFSVLDNLSNSLITKVSNIFNTLKYTVKPEVDSLNESITSVTTTKLEAANLHIVADPTNADGLIEPEDYDWGNTFLSDDAVIAAIGGIVPDLRVQMSSLHALANNETRLHVTDLKFDQATVDDICRRWEERLSSLDNGVKAAEIYQLISDDYLFQGWYWPVIRDAANGSDFASLLRTINNLLRDYGDAIDALRSVPLDVSAEMQSKILDNLDTARNFMVELCFIKLALREYYRNALVLPCGCINPDQGAEATAANLTRADIAKYIQLYHTNPGIAIPNSGITIDQIAAAKDSTATKFDELQSTRLLQANSLKLTYMIQAAREVLSDYLRSTDVSRLPTDMTIDVFVKIKTPLIQTLTNRLNTSADNNLDSLLYEFVIAVHYPDTMVATAHRMLGYEIIQQLKVNPDISNENLAMVDVSVAARLIASFLMTELCCAHK